MAQYRPRHTRYRAGSARASEALRDQRDANESLLLAVVRAHEQADAQRDANEHLVLAATSARDESEASAAAVEELRSTALSRERFVAMVGHDLRNPLGTVVLAAGGLLRGGRLDEADSASATRIVRSGKRMTSMLASLFAFTQARVGGGIALHLGPVDLGAICLDVAEELRFGSTCEIVVDVEGDVRGTWDAVRLAQVISNLAGNAVDHAFPGTPVHIRIRGDGERVTAEVTNEGTDIASHAMGRIFDAFHGMAARREMGAHLGLGLYIAQEITRSHGGAVDVSSSAGSTTFVVRLPRSASGRTAPRTEA